jgi:hypothetical protein
MINEYCPHCENDVELELKFQPQICSSCKNIILPCSLCDTNAVECSKCPLSALLEAKEEVERENQKYKECSSFNVALDQVLYKDGTIGWEVSIEQTNGTNDISKFEKYEDALEEYNSNDL